MSLPSPNLDDRNFYQLLEEARQMVKQSCPEWTDLSPGDPGWALLELFAYLTDILLYRLNRLPEKAYIEFLRLLGVKLYPPSAAGVELCFSLSRPQEQPVTIPSGIRITTNRTGGEGEQPIFMTARTATIEPGCTEVRVPAYHCDLVAAELVGRGTGLAGLSVTVRRPPIVALTSDDLELLVGVEAMPEELGDRVRAIQHNGKTYRIWREVENFANLGPNQCVYLVDRLAGTITFAPSIYLSSGEGQLQATAQTSAAIPGNHREIRLWYYRGGGTAGNVAAHTLKVLKDSLPGVQVTNPQPATGGRDAETLANALLRGPQELRSLERAVTASDFELLALKSSGAVSRAKAFTKAQFWRYATPGTVEVLLVPELPPGTSTNQPIRAEQLQRQETQKVCQQIQQALDERRPLGTTCSVNWVRYKTVTVKAEVVVHRGEDPAAVRDRVLQRLAQTINPWKWQFGQPLRVDRVYEIILAEPGVSYVEQVRFRVDEVPHQQVQVVAADPVQHHTWYATATQTLFRSLNDGDSWELLQQFPQEEIKVVKTHAQIPGLLAIATRLQTEESGSRIYFSFDCGETWRLATQTSFIINDLAWILRASGFPVLLMATMVGLYALATQPEANPVQLLVDPANQDLGFYAVAAATDVRGTLNIAVAARGTAGVFLSLEEGKSGTFRSIGLQGEDVRVLEVQRDGPRSFLWAGVYVAGNEMDKGCFRWELTGSAEGWRQFQQGWSGGSCRSLAFRDSLVFASTYASGILKLDSSRGDSPWQTPDVSCGLPTRDREYLFDPINAIALGVNLEGETILLAGSPEGVYRSEDEGNTYDSASRQEFTEKVMLPANWLFCSGAHEIEVVSR
ncbi:MAG: putative baseplate assembly protein [Xenococcaceae cyanobacterium]